MSFVSYVEGGLASMYNYFCNTTNTKLNTPQLPPPQTEARTISTHEVEDNMVLVNLENRVATLTIEIQIANQRIEQLNDGFPKLQRRFKSLTIMLFAGALTTTYKLYNRKP